MKNLTDFRKTVETGVDPRLHMIKLAKPPLKQLFGNATCIRHFFAVGHK